ncbi:MAG: hypothetical protein LBQ27_00480 [Clostridiales bacterium]|jgi:hypothetical protein|nr:hypothetical protein [Clostridiales bacterium]
MAKMYKLEKARLNTCALEQDDIIDTKESMKYEVFEISFTSNEDGETISSGVTIGSGIIKNN